MIAADEAREFRLRCHPGAADRYDVNYLIGQLQDARDALGQEFARAEAAEDRITESEQRWFDHATALQARGKAAEAKVNAALAVLDLVPHIDISGTCVLCKTRAALTDPPKAEPETGER